MGLLSAAGTYLAGRKYQPYQPSKANLASYEARQRGDIDRLYGPEPYKGSDLGFSRNVMQGLTAEGRDLTRGEYTGGKQRLADAYRRAGGYGMKSAQYERGREDLERGRQVGMALVNRRNIIADAMQRRTDFSSRFQKVAGAYGYGTGLYNRAQAAKYQARRAGYEAVGGAVEEGAKGVLGGLMGG
jgi:hypothetical protein